MIDGEDIVQETLAKAFDALSQSTETPPLRPWLFRIAHNTALDFLKCHGRKTLDNDADVDDVAGAADRGGPIRSKFVRRCSVRGLISDDCRLDLVSKSQRRGKQVGVYFGKQNVALRVVKLDAAKQLALAGRPTSRRVDGARAHSYSSAMTRMGSKRWNDDVADDDGTRILVSRYRPRGVTKADETWSEWHRELAPSTALHAAYYGKFDVAITWEQYRTKFLSEMNAQRGHIEELAKRVARGERITLLCSSACTNPARCHRTLLIELVDEVLRA